MNVHLLPAEFPFSVEVAVRVVPSGHAYGDQVRQARPNDSKTRPRVPLPMAEQTSHRTPTSTEKVAETAAKIEGSRDEFEAARWVHAPYAPATAPMTRVEEAQKAPR